MIKWVLFFSFWTSNDVYLYRNIGMSYPLNTLDTLDEQMSTILWTDIINGIATDGPQSVIVNIKMHYKFTPDAARKRRFSNTSENWSLLYCM